MRKLLVVVLLAGCGGRGPVLGSACDTKARDARCTGAKTVAYCESDDAGSRWVEYFADGGCTDATDGGYAQVNFAGSAGALCPVTMDGYSECSGDRVLTCRSVWLSYVCGACSVKNSLIECNNYYISTPIGSACDVTEASGRCTDTGQGVVCASGQWYQAACPNSCNWKNDSRTFATCE